MKPFILLLIGIVMSISSYSQIKPKTVVFKAVDTSVLNKTQYTGIQYTDSKGVKYPIYKSVRGKLYVMKVSGKTGLPYKMYLKSEKYNNI